jgi:prevent-host-death family protein
MDKMKEIAAGEFKAKCLQLMDTVQRTKTPIVITKRGKPVAQLVAVESETADFFGCLKGSVKIVSDIVAPIDVEWEANE